MEFAQHAGISKLYHYEPLKSEHLKTVLSDYKIHVSNIGNVNDPWDCRPFFEADVTTPEQKSGWIAFFRAQYAELSDAQQKTIACENPAWMNDETILMDSITKTTANVVANNVRFWRMYCLTPHPDSILMWSHYASRHTGICLEFDVQGTIFGRARKVGYREDFQIISPALLGDGPALAETILLTKSKDWQYENQFRLLVRDRQFASGFSLTSENDLLALPAAALTALIIGARCSEADASSIKALVEEHAPGLMVKRAVCAPHKYDVSITI